MEKKLGKNPFTLLLIIKINEEVYVKDGTIAIRSDRPKNDNDFIKRTEYERVFILLQSANKEQMIFQLNPKGNVYFCCVYLFCSFYAIKMYVYETSESLDKLGSTACFMFLKYHA